MDLCWQSNVSAFEYAVQVGDSFSSKEQASFKFMPSVTIWSDLGVQKKNQIRSDQISRSVMSNSLWPHESQHARPSCPSPTPRVHWDSHPSSQWCHPAISSSVVPFSSCSQSLPGVSALVSFLPKKSQGWSPSEWTGWISLQSKGLSRVFSNVTFQKHQFFST